MNYKNVLLFGRDAYAFIYQYFELVAPIKNDKDFLYDPNIFIFNDSGKKIRKKLFNYNKNLQTNAFEFNLESFFKYFINSLNNSSFIKQNFDSLKLDIDKLKNDFGITKIFEKNRSKSLFNSYKEIKLIVLNFLIEQAKPKFTKITIKSEKDENSKEDISLDFIIDKFDDVLDTFFFEWLNETYKKAYFLFNRYIYLKNPIDLFLKKTNGVKVNDENNYIFSIEAFRNNRFHFSDILEVYLSYEKVRYLKDTVLSRIKEYDSIYSLAEVNLLDWKGVKSLHDYFADDNFGKNLLNRDINVKTNNIGFKNENNVDLIEYFPDLTNLDILDSSHFETASLKRILKNPFLDTINFYLYDFENKDHLIEKIKTIKNENNISFNYYSMNEFFSEITPAKIEELQKTNNLKYELIWSHSKSYENNFIFPIRLLKEIGGREINEVGGYVSSLFNLSQFGKCWIEPNSIVANSARINDDVIIQDNSIIKNNALISGKSFISDSTINKFVTIKDNSNITKAIINDNVFIYKNTVIRGKANRIPNISNNVKIGLDVGAIKGNVVISENALLLKSVYIDNHDKNPLKIQGNAVLMGQITAQNAIIIKDNATLEGKISVNDNVEVSNNAFLKGDISLHHNVKIFDNAIVGTDKTKIIMFGNVNVYENAKILGDAYLFNKTKIYGNTEIFATIIAKGNCKIFGNFILRKPKDSEAFTFNSIEFGKNWIKNLRNTYPEFTLLINNIEIKNVQQTNSKFKLTNIRKVFYHPKLKKNITVYRIQSNQDFDDIKRNDFGGYVESLQNLDQYGRSWIYDSAIVCGNARLKDNAKIFDNVVVLDNAIIGQEAIVEDSVFIQDSSRILGKAYINGDTLISDISVISAKVKIKNAFEIKGNTWIYDNSIIKNGSVIESSKIQGFTVISSPSHLVNSQINNSTINGYLNIINSNVDDSSLKDNSQIKNSIVINSLVTHSSLIENCVVQDSRFANNAMIKNSVSFKGFFFNSVEVRDSKIENTNVTNKVKITNSIVISSQLNDFVVLNNSLVETSIISKIAFIDKSNIVSSYLSGDVNVFNTNLNYVYSNKRVLIESSMIENTFIKTNLNIKNSQLKDENFDRENNIEDDSISLSITNKKS